MPQDEADPTRQGSLAPIRWLCHGAPVRRPLLLAALILAAVVALPAASGAATRPGLAALRGPWAGTLDGASPVITVSIRLSGGKRGSKIAFTGGLECSGVLIYLGRRTRTFVFSEQIRRSATDSCGALGIVEMRLRLDGRLDYRWRAVGADIAPGRATLERVVLG